MFTIVDKIGTPSWLRIPQDDSEVVEVKSSEALQEARKIIEFPSRRTRDEIYEMLRCLMFFGKGIFELKNFRRSEEIYKSAYELSLISGNTPKEIRSLLNSNIALCWLKLECPFECIESSRLAIELNCKNIKAHYCLATSLYAIYEFEEALKHISLGLDIDPKCFGLITLKKKVKLNQISRNISTEVFEKRLKMYKKEPEHSLAVTLIPELPLLGLDLNNEKFSFLEISKTYIGNKTALIDYYLKTKRFTYALEQLINLHQIYHTMTIKYQEQVSKNIFRDIFCDKSRCLYYIEHYEDALENLACAKDLMNPSFNQLTLEIKILCKLKRFDEAFEIFNKSMFVSRTSVEKFIIEEILFEMVFKKSGEMNIRGNHFHSPDVNIVTIQQDFDLAIQNAFHENSVDHESIENVDEYKKSLNDNQAVSIEKVLDRSHQSSSLDHTCLAHKPNKLIDRHELIGPIISCEAKYSIDKDRGKQKSRDLLEFPQLLREGFANNFQMSYEDLFRNNESISSATQKDSDEEQSEVFYDCRETVEDNLSQPSRYITTSGIDWYDIKYKSKLNYGDEQLESQKCPLTYEAFESKKYFDEREINADNYVHNYSTFRNIEKEQKFENCQSLVNVSPTHESFPLPLEKYDIRIVCSTCLQNPDECIDCPENILAVKNKQNEQWITIRERVGHRHFYGNYKKCEKFPYCHVIFCTFAHSDEEAIIWSKEKENTFCIRTFITSHRSRNATEVQPIEALQLMKSRPIINDRTFICFVDEQNYGIMVPINKEIPRIKLIEEKNVNNNISTVCIYTCENSNFELKSKIYVNKLNPFSPLYLVKILKWEIRFNWPLGIVIDKITPSTEIDDVMRILDLEHNIPEPLNKDIVYKDIGKAEKRYDYRNKLIFTIDGKYTKDIDDAIGFEIVDSDFFLLSIHISDVSFYIDPQSDLDNEAKKRATSYYPPNREPIHMLPEKYSTDICSLKEGEDRRALSIFITLDKNGDTIADSISIKRTWIRSKHRLTYEDVESVLMDHNSSLERFPRNLVSALKKINEISIKWRNERLGSDALEWTGDIFSLDGPNSRALISEMMIQANKIVAEFLLEKSSSCTPLRVQAMPDESDLNSWRTNFFEIVTKTFGLRRFLKNFPSICRCIGFCSCAMNNINTNGSTLENLLFHKIRADISIKKIQKKAKYLCSASNLRYHFLLNAEAYTHFTSPIRRYIDLVVHRLVINCIENLPPAYTEQEIIEICQDFNAASKIASDYYDASYNALMCDLLQTRPLKVNAVITSINENYEIELHFMNWHKTFRSTFIIKPSHLGLLKQPENKDKYTIFRCNKKTLLNSHHQSPLYTNSPLDHLLDGECAKSYYPIKDVINDQEILENCNLNEISNYSQIEVEVNHDHCLVKLKPSDILTVQISSKLHCGLTTQYVQMVYLSNSTSICIEHIVDPIKCFCDLQCESASKETYASLDKYKQLWKSVLSLECAQNAITGGAPVTVHNVEFQWDTHNNGNEICGRFQLEKNFFEKLQAVKFTNSKILKCNAYLCVQYPDILMPFAIVDKRIKVLENASPATLVIHCIVENVKYTNDPDLIELSCKVKQCSIRSLNMILKHISSNKKVATVEWNGQPSPMRRMMKSLEKLGTNLELAAIIACNNKSFPCNDETFNLEWPNYAKPNTFQEQAIKKSMKLPFSLIQGPPGTGKTYVMAHLIDQFYKSNKNTDQVMCCGPSNKSADVIATSLLKLNPHVPLLRIYGESTENKRHPLPFVISFFKEKNTLEDKKIDEILSDHSLHHLIRNEKKCEQAKEILEHENYFSSRDFNEEMDEGRIKKYLELKAVAEQTFILKAKVIITTCIGCGNPKLKRCHIKQLLIDECSMCTEPESMVPIVCTEAKHVVLIGDHKQLKPIVFNKCAEKFGMETSLFQRYCKNTFMLTVQYRMHEAIAEFPSEQFYDKKLRIGDNIKQRKPSEFNFWPGGKDTPIAFVNVGGLEESLTTSTEEGGFESKKNDSQAKLAVKIASKMVQHYNVKKEDILILSQYRSQCCEISKLLKNIGLSISVSTVVSAQGSERKYIILSTVRSLPKQEIIKNPGRSWIRQHLGFVADPHQINVALTRAQEGLIILGNKDLLSFNRMWNDLINHYQDKKALVEVPDNSNSSSCAFIKTFLE